MHPVINFSHVTKEYPLYHHIGSGIKDLIFHPKRAFQLLKGRKYLAIEDVSFTVGKGEAVALIGRNGAGKSTSLGLVAGVIKPTKGKPSPLKDGWHRCLNSAEDFIRNLPGVRIFT